MEINTDQDFESIGRALACQLLEDALEKAGIPQAPEMVVDIVDVQLRMGIMTPQSLYLYGRNEYVFELRTQHNKSAVEIAAAFGITRQMVHLVIRERWAAKKRLLSFVK